MEDETVRLQLTISGMVQGVGFRPFVHALARRLDLAGYVANDSHGVTIEVEGDGRRVARFVVALERETPPLALIERVSTREVPRQGATPPFVIAPASRATRGPPSSRPTSPPARTACGSCSIRPTGAIATRSPTARTAGRASPSSRDVPYDRAATTMAAFPMCAACAGEYDDPADRRFHAQPIALPAVRSASALVDAGGHGGDRRSAPRRGAAAPGRAHRRRQGARRLPPRRRRDDERRRRGAARPQAPRGQAVRRDGRGRRTEPQRLAMIDPDDAAAADSRPRARSCCSGGAPTAPRSRRRSRPGNRSLGVMLPYTPLHHLLVPRASARRSC